MTSSCDIVVIGAGVLGLCTAAELRARGREVVVVDPGGANASSVAAGMIAPAMESVLEPWAADPVGRAGLLRTARDLWPDFAERHGIELIRDGVDWIGDDPAGVTERLAALGFAAERSRAGVFCSEDWRVEPERALAALGQTLDRRADRVSEVAAEGEGWALKLASGVVLTCKQVVLACGMAFPCLPEPVAAQLTDIQAIGGRLAFVSLDLVTRPVRFDGGYVVPAPGGALIGATMEAGGLAISAEDLQAQLLERARLALGLNELGPVEWRTGVRGATPDGLPREGPSALPGLHFALAPRRNGWLMGPWVARQLADALAR